MTTRPACEACGSFEAKLHETHYAGWLCDDVAACLARIDASGATVVGVLTVTRQSPLDPVDHGPEFGDGPEFRGWAERCGDIPERNQKKVVIMASGGRYAESFDPTTVATAKAIMAELKAMDPDFGEPSDIHGTGRCTCGGEGRCAWCQEICDRCWGDPMDPPCFACNCTGYADGLSLTMDERAAKVEAIRADEPDYEALGYQETRSWETRPEFELQVVVDIWAAGPVWSLLDEMAVIQKDIRSPTDNG